MQDAQQRCLQPHDEQSGWAPAGVHAFSQGPGHVSRHAVHAVRRAQAGQPARLPVEAGIQQYGCPWLARGRRGIVDVLLRQAFQEPAPSLGKGRGFVGCAAGDERWRRRRRATRAQPLLRAAQRLVGPMKCMEEPHLLEVKREWTHTSTRGWTPSVPALCSCLK